MKGGGSNSITMRTARQQCQLIGHAHVKEQLSSSIEGGV
jgi:hypothetical protein